MATMTEVEQASVPIGAVSRITGLSGHTLRKWETRYQAVVPQRTESGRRLYSQQQIQRLLLLKELSAQGFPIGQVGRLSDAELQALRAEQPVAAVEEQFDRVTVTISPGTVAGELGALAGAGLAGACMVWSPTSLPSTKN